MSFLILFFSDQRAFCKKKAEYLTTMFKEEWMVKVQSPCLKLISKFHFPNSNIMYH